MSKYIAVIGSGGTAYGAAATFTALGHHVTLADIPARSERLEDVRKQGGILLRGNGVRGQYLPETITTDVADAVEKNEIILVAAQAERHPQLAEAIAPGIHDGQVIVLVPGNAGSLVFDKVFRESGVHRDAILLELQGNLFPNRRTGPAEVNSGGKLRKKRAAAFPAKDTEKAIERLRGVLELEPAKNVFETTINTPNSINHLTGTLLNTTQIEKAGKSFHLFLDGLTPSVFVGLDAAYAEEKAVLEKLGYFVQPNPAEHLRLVAEYGQHPEFDIFRSLAGPDSLTNRYVTEDAPIGVSLLVSLAAKVGVPVPYNAALLTIASTLNKTDYYASGRTLENFGLAEKSIEEINAYLEEGTK
jgi:opine dehydrogenase